ncbi:N-acyl amino acid synthase FeeM domain-containing protein [Pseudothauera rhizosphaerae]|uniref:Long-chain N-acyl amino acid synthase n=1 Tax=Pseudothauera rhizosphaerae TaxID=2565932 RepID=A0A4V3WB46_9RHOO|nr:long-chain N-acyl amino acid synthase [Pseudothauera rhizosphaerae]THF61640.1 long-chain N-acyl amino acid synthase [Pseudothauera rhizosphaerae]
MKPEHALLEPRARVLPAFASSPAHAQDDFQPSTFDQHFTIDCDGYQIRLADHSDTLRTRISLLIEKLYAWRGLQASHANVAPLPHQTTLVACRDDHHLFGTVTLGLDSCDGLMADGLYQDEIDEIRRSGGRVCEVTRLAIDPEFGSHRVMAQLFHLVFILARMVHGMTDLFAEVHPRHSDYYRRMLGYRLAGPEKVCPRVGAPAVLLHISLADVERHIRERGEGRTLYRHFFPLEEQWRLFDQLREPLSQAIS